MNERPLVDLLTDPSAPWAFSPDLEAGDVLMGREEYPDIEVVNNELYDIQKIQVQLLRVKDPGTGDDCIMRRLIGVLHDGKQVDIGERFVVPSILVEHEMDVSKCNACFEKIQEDELVIFEGKAYHDRCMED